MALTNVEMASKALVLIGADAITDFDATSTEAIVANTTYETVVEAALTRTRWRFASGQQTLSRLVDTPAARWDAAYQKPASPHLLALHAVTVLNNPIEFDIYEDMIYCNAADPDTVVADYTYRAATADWPPYFVMALMHDLASIFAGSVAQKGDLAEYYGKKAEILYTKAQNLESQQRTTKRVNARKNLINRRF